jgi:effector-binding domain-containing protein
MTIQLVLFNLLFLVGSAVAIEEPKYTVQSRTDHYEIRRYPKILVAQTLVDANFDDAGNKAFRILADYIFGNNKPNKKIAMTAPVSQTASSEKIAMTAPVTQVKGQTGFLVQFTMPENYTMENLPQPNDPRVQIRELPAHTVAVYEYSGSWSESRYQEKLTDFRRELEKAGVKTTGEPVFARFNSPFRLWFLRRNEIWLEVP